MRTRQDPGQTRLGPHLRVGLASAHQPGRGTQHRSCDSLGLSSHSPTANQSGAECHHCGHPHPRQTTRRLLTPHPAHAKGPDLAGTSSLGPRKDTTHNRQAPTPCRMQMPHGVTNSQGLQTYSRGLHLSRVIPKSQGSYWPPASGVFILPALHQWPVQRSWQLNADLR